ncbi:chemotaxis protein CheD [Natronobacterium gregoryi]|uniref:Probable chemoreceptor glutamine deamidase CheD n=2 Tax=Natronobacterium gregoryi TaxID=44930 RepID=L0AFC7_NATGS|nr:chemotaxis protein CheD [Natronobacterium gregoryi]AFZ71765.1 chemotaxis protein [Natronobacterium gregoryi SP2]ELY72850.1 protein CheD [Natronobacterium gregoryi SP2]PLK21054.1 chemotaxis protein CheD [Natronobacterium gregoryi SP2]SFI88334.1 chemotaxis protein CheD [Natronobacterium gregoryi]
MKTYGTEPGIPSPARVGISEITVSEGDDTLTSYGLGSCLAIALYDPETEIGGLAHAMLPDGDAAENSDRKPGKYANTAIRALLRRMVENGASYTSVEAKIAGGSDMFEFDSFGDGVGQRNVVAAKDELERLGVPLVAEDVGGETGRTVEFTPGTGALVVRSANESGETRKYD